MTETTAPFTFKVAVGSANPAKIRSVLNALESVIGKDRMKNVNLDIQGFSVASGVSDQPMGDDETKVGAKTRAKACYNAYKEANEGREPHLSVGLEGGLEIVENVAGGDFSNEPKSLICMAWMAVYGTRTKEILQWSNAPDCPKEHVSPSSDSPTWGLAKTGTFTLPPMLSKLILEDGLELGDADDKCFGRTKSKHGSGSVGILTGDLIDRSHYYEHALVLALIPWIRPDVYPL